MSDDMKSNRYGDGTRVVRSGSTQPVPGMPMHNGPVFAAPFHLADSEPGAGGADVYARYNNPTVREFETALGELDGGRSLAFASGMAALSAVFYGCVSSGQRLLIPSDGYFTGRLLADTHLRRFGMEIATVPTAVVEQRLRAGDFSEAKLIMVETPSNPALDVCDIAVVAELAHQQGSLLAVDNTTATPLGQRPLALGADIVVASDTKALAGHSDLLMGHVSGATRPGQSQARSKPGWRTAVWAPWTCGWPVRPRTQPPWPRYWPEIHTYRTCAGRGGPAIRRTRSRVGRCCGRWVSSRRRSLRRKQCSG
jgi:cystathionine gamma-lyase